MREAVKKKVRGRGVDRFLRLQRNGAGGDERDGEAYSGEGLRMHP